MFHGSVNIVPPLDPTSRLHILCKYILGVTSKKMLGLGVGGGRTYFLTKKDNGLTLINLRWKQNDVETGSNNAHAQ